MKPETGGDDAEEWIIRRFQILSVFDISQTEAIEGVEQVGDLTSPVAGDDETGIVDRITEWLKEQGWTVDLEPIKGRANGYTTTDGSKRVVIDRRRPRTGTNR